MPNMEELIVTIETNPSNIGAPDVAALYVRPKGDTTSHPRRLVIYPTRKSFHDAHPDLDNTRGQNGLFVPSSHEMYEPLLYPLLAIGGTSNPGYGAHYFQPTIAGKVTLQKYKIKFAINRARARSGRKLQARRGRKQHRRSAMVRKDEGRADVAIRPTRLCGPSSRPVSL